LQVSNFGLGQCYIQHDTAPFNADVARAVFPLRSGKESQCAN